MAGQFRCPGAGGALPPRGAALDGPRRWLGSPTVLGKRLALPRGAGELKQGDIRAVCELPAKERRLGGLESTPGGTTGIFPCGCYSLLGENGEFPHSGAAKSLLLASPAVPLLAALAGDGAMQFQRQLSQLKHAQPHTSPCCSAHTRTRGGCPGDPSPEARSAGEDVAGTGRWGGW